MGRKSELKEVAIYFLRLGATAFGGPAAHIAMMRDEAVVRRKWMDDRRFLDLLGVTNLIPGPNSTEMAIQIGLQRAGRAGLVLAGLFFILPSMLMVTVLAWLYVRFGATPAADRLLYGVKPVIIAVVVQALSGLGRSAVKGPLTAVAGLAAVALFFLCANPVMLLFGAGLVVMMVEGMIPTRTGVALLITPMGAVPAGIAAKTPFTFSVLFLKFLKIGATLYGSGYVLLAFLHADFVTKLGWLSDRQLLDAIAVGQVTPGPVFTTATFIGYVLGGVPGALLATLAIFLPSFLFVALSGVYIDGLRRSRRLSGFLDGVNVAALGLMAAVTYNLGKAAFVDVPTIAVAAVSSALLLRFKVNSTWLVLAGAGAGFIRGMF